MFFFLGRKIAIKFYQFRNALGRFIPRKSNTRVGAGNIALADFDSLAVVPFFQPVFSCAKGYATDSIYLF